MYLKKEALWKLMDEKAEGVYRKFARQLGVYPEQLHRILNRGSNPGPKFFGKLMTYCRENDLDFDDYVSLVPLEDVDSEGQSNGHCQG